MCTKLYTKHTWADTNKTHKGGGDRQAPRRRTNREWEWIYWRRIAWCHQHSSGNWFHIWKTYAKRKVVDDEEEGPQDKDIWHTWSNSGRLGCERFKVKQLDVASDQFIGVSVMQWRRIYWKVYCCCCCNNTLLYAISVNDNGFINKTKLSSQLLFLSCTWKLWSAVSSMS